MKTRAMLSAAILPLALAAMANANETAAPSSNGATSALDDRDVIIVTAQKREQTLQEVPAALTAVSGEQFLERGFSDATDLSKMTPNFIAATDRGDVNLSIRGVGSRVRGSTPAVAMHIDGVYQPRPAMANLTQVDLERIEVLRGPQGTLYGRNANGGAVNFITAAPGETVEGYVLGNYQNFDEYRVQAAVTLPLSENFRVRLSADRTDRGEGTVEHVSGGQDLNSGSTNLFRARADWGITEKIDFSLGATYADREGPFTFFQAVDLPGEAGIAVNLAPMGAPINLATAPISTAPNTTAHDTFTDSDRDYLSLSGTLNAELNDVFSIRSITAYQEFNDAFEGDFDATGLELTPNTRGFEAETFTQELNLLFETDRLSGVAGVFYMDDEQVGSNTFNFGPRGVALTRATTNPDAPMRAPNDPIPGSVTTFSQLGTTTESLSFFVDVTVDITEKLNVFGGVRYNEDELSISNRHTSEFSFATQTGPFAPGDYRLYICPTNPNPGPPITTPQSAALLDPTDASLEFESTTPRVGANYQVNGNSSIYASYSQGFKSGGFNEQTGCGDSFDSETVDSFEIGTKNVLLDGTLVLNAGAFFYDYEDLQVEQLTGFAFEFNNAPGAEVYGVEAEAVYTPNDNWRFDANFSYQNSEFTEFSNLDSLNHFTRDANGNVVVDGNGVLVPNVQDLAGNPLPYAPDVTANLGVSYETDPVFNGGSFLISGNMNYASTINFREFDAPEDEQEGRALFDASAGWTNGNDDLTLRVFGKNITDEEYLVSLASGSATNSRFGVYGLPRQYGFEILKRF